MNVVENYDVVIVGAGHAGCEAALASARLGLNTIVFTVTAQAKYFKNSDQAKDFLYDVMLQPVVKTIQIEKQLKLHIKWHLLM